jgi:hypothetical protein
MRRFVFRFSLASLLLFSGRGEGGGGGGGGGRGATTTRPPVAATALSSYKRSVFWLWLAGGRGGDVQPARALCPSTTAGTLTHCGLLRQQVAQHSIVGVAAALVCAAAAAAAATSSERFVPHVAPAHTHTTSRGHRRYLVNEEHADDHGSTQTLKYDAVVHGHVFSLDADLNTVDVRCSPEALVITVRAWDVAAVNFGKGTILVGSELWGCVGEEGPVPFYRRVVGT